MPRLKRKSKEMRKKQINELFKIKWKNDEYKDQCRIAMKKRQQMRLTDAENRNIHKIRLRSNQRKRLNDGGQLKVHTERNKRCQSKRLLNHRNREAHKLRMQISQARRLRDPKKRLLHKKRLIKYQRIRLQQQRNIALHRLRLIKCQQNRLRDPLKHLSHKKRLVKNQMIRLKLRANRELHRRRLIILQKKRMARENYRISHYRRCSDNYHNRTLTKIQSTNNKCINKYLRDIKEGPSNACVCCGRLWFKNSLSYHTFQRIIDKKITKGFLMTVCPNFEDNNNVGYLCKTCKKHILKNKIPPLSLCNAELQFPVVSDTLKNMTALEERFVAPRIPFMRIQTLSHAGQFAIHGKVVNVPIDVPSSVNILPRLPHETDVVPIALKKKKAYKSNYLFEPVRPNIIIKAVSELKDSEVYRAANITVDNNRIESLVTFHNSIVNDRITQRNDEEEVCINNKDKASSEDGGTEELEPLNVPAEETLLQPNAIVFAPGEDNRPLPILLDEHAESMSFIKIYGGFLRKIPDSITYHDCVKSEITRKDRRCCSLPKLFYSAYKIRYQMVSNKISFCLRQTKNKPLYTAGQLLDDNELKQVELYDSGYKVFASDRGSPSYWESKKKEVFAMLRQLGPPTFFLTLSAAETRWPELLVLLKRVLDDTEISEEEALALTFVEKCRLIREDPVTCSRYFDYRVRQLFSLMRTSNTVFEVENQIVDYYIRTEFQQRGSPHVHCLIWIKNAPQYNPDSENLGECCTFVDKYITCLKSSNNEPFSYQNHKHTATCKKITKNGAVCRFNFPLYPMSKTTILTPLDDNLTDDERVRLKQNVKVLNSLLQDCSNDKENSITFDEFLKKLNMSEDDYIKTIRFKIKRTLVCLKREPSETMINQYNHDILTLHKANMDIQFITDKYSLVHYVLNYVNKSCRGISKAMADAMEEIKGGNYTIREKLKHLANKFLNASEFSAQEAIYFILSIPLSKSSRSSVFINTNRPEKRVSVVKSKKELMQMHEESTDVTAKNMLDYYVNRPAILENICLADFAANYNYSKTEQAASKQRKDNNTDDDAEQNVDYEEEIQGLHRKSFKLENKMGYVKKRTRSKIIRYVNFNKVQNETEYFREQAMLFFPWRNETHELLTIDVAKLYQDNMLSIHTNRAKFVFSNSYDTAHLNDIANEVIRNGNVDEENETVANDNQYAVLDDRTDEGGFEISNQDKPVKGKEPVETFPIPNMIPEDEYQSKMRHLNENQRKYLIHVLHLMKRDFSGLYECVLGGAGVGKSMLIECIQQSIIRYYNSIPGNTITDLRVLLTAPTGKAAYNIKGITLHSAFILPLNQASTEMLPLSSSTCNTLLSSMNKVKLIIIDEISMVGCKMFGQIDSRLKQIFQQDLPFGGRNVILFGDFNQLPPVGDRFIFQTLTDNPYSTLIRNPLWSLFKGFKLTEIMRQREDALFASALNRLAEGKLNPSDILLFKSRENKTIGFHGNDEAIHLFRSNNEVDLFNNYVIMRKTKEVIESKALDVILGEQCDKTKESVLNQVKKLRSQNTFGLPFSINLAIGIKYMLTNNINVKDGLVNGAVGILNLIEKVDSNLSRLWLYFENPEVGKNTRSEINLNKTAGQRVNVTPIDKIKRNIQVNRKSRISVVREQFPLVPAEALTIYKSQGSTYNQVHVHLSKGLKRNELYVACSRATSVNGLMFDGEFKAPTPPSCHDPVPFHVKEMLQDRPVTLSVTNLQDNKGSELTFYFHNIQSLNKHLPDLKSDKCALSADILILVETWILSSDKLEIAGYDLFINIPSDQRTRKPCGVAVFKKHELEYDCSVIFLHNVNVQKERCNMVAFECGYYCFCILYKPPSTKFSYIHEEFKKMLEIAVQTRKKVIVVGDFNIDYIGKNSHKCFEVINQFNLHLAVSNNVSSNNSKSQIDLCFSNFPNIKAEYYESYYSYHKPIIGIISKENENDNEISKDRGVIKVCTGSFNNRDDYIPQEHFTENANIVRDIDRKSNFLNAGARKSTGYGGNFQRPDIMCNELNRLPKGFTNIDNVSCYCNSACQSIFINSTALEVVINNEPESGLGLVAKEYTSTDSRVIDSTPLRLYIDIVLEQDVYSKVEHQDVSEFLSHLIQVFPSLNDLVSHQYSTKRKCTSCNFESATLLPNSIVGIELPDINNTTTINGMYQHQFNTWKTIENSMCLECGQVCEKLEKCTIIEPKELLILQLGLWKVVNDQVRKRTVKVKNAPKDDLNVAGIRYKLKSAIFHHGQSVRRGHYTAMIRINANNWIQANDEIVSRCTWPRLCKDAYVFIYERM